MSPPADKPPKKTNPRQVTPGIAELRPSERTFRGLFELSPLGIVLSSPGGDVIECNPALARMLGYPSPERMKRGVPNLTALFGLDGNQLPKAAFQPVQARMPKEYEGHLRHKDGTVRKVGIYIQTMDCGPGGQSCQCIYVREISANDRDAPPPAVDPGEICFATLLDHLPAGVHLLDPQANLLYANRRARELFGEGKPRGQAHGRHLPPELAAALGVDDRRVPPEGSDVQTVDLQTSDGRERTFRIYRFAIRHHDRPVLIAALSIDFTREKRTATRLTKARADLELKSSHLQEMNVVLKVLLKKRDEDKNELEQRIMFNLKELVTPYLEKLEDTPLDPRQKAYVRVMQTNIVEIMTPFIKGMSEKMLTLTPSEIQVVNLIKQGRTTKDMAEMLHLSPRTIETYRDTIRRKFSLKNKGINLRTFLLTMN